MLLLLCISRRARTQRIFSCQYLLTCFILCSSNSQPFFLSILYQKKMSSSLETRLCDIRTQIQQHVSQVRSNQLQRQRLSARIDQLIEPLERLEHATSLFI